MSDLLLTGRVALVTGGSRGIGAATCRLLAENGARVVVNYRQAAEAANKVVGQITSNGGEAVAIAGDVATETGARRLVADACAAVGPIDLLVNNAGIFDLVDHNETTSEIWDRTIATNLSSAYHVTWAVKDDMIARGFGRIVNVTSIAGLRGRSHGIAYSVSKAGLISLTKCCSDALAPHNIRVNAVAPGLIETEILDGVQSATLEKIIDATPIQRYGRPEEIAQTILFLLSERSSFTTGQTLVASGGRVLLP